MGERGEGIKKDKSAVTKQSRDVKYNIGNTVNDIAICPLFFRPPIRGQGKGLGTSEPIFWPGTWVASLYTGGKELTSLVTVGPLAPPADHSFPTQLGLFVLWEPRGALRSLGWRDRQWISWENPMARCLAISLP